jgi:hypothetical protein
MKKEGVETKDMIFDKTENHNLVFPKENKKAQQTTQS